MVISEHNIIYKFHEYNDLYFNGTLPFPQLKVRHSYRTLGYFYCDIDEYGRISNETIEISDSYNYTEEQLRDVLVHEMIHYYLLYIGLDKKCTHGKQFKKMCKEFNEKYGMHLSKRIDISNYNIKEGNSKLWFNICTFF